jgi:hypothetical protein
MYGQRHLLVLYIRIPLGVRLQLCELRRINQPVEKVGAGLTVTTNWAPEAPNRPKNGVCGAHSGFEAGIEGVFQQAVTFPEGR